MRSLRWGNVAAGIWLIMAPWVLGYVNPTATAEDVVLGVVVTIVALWAARASATASAAVWIQVVLAIWICIAPWVLGYSYAGVAVTNDVIVGVLIASFAVGSTIRHRIPEGPQPPFTV